MAYRILCALPVSRGSIGETKSIKANCVAKASHPSPLTTRRSPRLARGRAPVHKTKACKDPSEKNELSTELTVSTLDITTNEVTSIPKEAETCSLQDTSATLKATLLLDGKPINITRKLKELDTIKPVHDLDVISLEVYDANRKCLRLKKRLIQTDTESHERDGSSSSVEHLKPTAIIPGTKSVSQSGRKQQSHSFRLISTKHSRSLRNFPYTGGVGSCYTIATTKSARKRGWPRWRAISILPL